MAAKPLTRRAALKTAAFASSSLLVGNLAKPFLRGAYAAGKLSCAFWDHWVPGANDSLRQLCQEWADKNHVELTVDFVTSQGDKLNITIAAEAQARSGHDLVRLSDSQPGAYAEHLEPMDDFVQSLIKQHGKLLLGSEFGGRQNGHWMATPVGRGTIAAPCAGRIDMLKQYAGLDVTKMYPAGAPPDKELVDSWTWDKFLTIAEKCFKAGHPFGLPLSTWSDSTNWVGSAFAAYGAELVDKDGNITVDSDATKQALDWFKRLVPSLPQSVFAWDNSGNNKWLNSGQGALILNPPSAWAVAVRDRPDVGEHLWHFPPPKGPKGRFVGTNFGFYGIWKFSPNIGAAKSLLAYLTTRSAFEKLVAGSRGYDIPPYENLRDFKTWTEEGPPKGVNYNYPPRGDVISLLAGYPAPVAIADHLWAQGTIVKLVARYTQEGHSMKEAITATEEEIEGYMRT